MSALILSGKEVAAKVLADVKAAVAALGEKTGVHPTLAVILVGEDPASQIYVRNKKRAADLLGLKRTTFLEKMKRLDLEDADSAEAAEA